MGMADKELDETLKRLTLIPWGDVQLWLALIAVAVLVALVL
jgi:hypothetical protein